jgi:hypothetical protein
LLFLGNFKAILAALASIPMVFFATLAIIWMRGGELNTVVYTAIILALGMLVDDAVVVLENIERHLNEMKEELNTAIIQGTREVIGPVFSGTVATIAIMVPFLFVGDFPQQIFRPLISTLIVALLVSYFLSIIFIPSISFFLYRKGSGKMKVKIRMSSVTFGAELGVLSLGSGSLPTEAMMTINCTNRFERKKDIWRIEDEIRSELMQLRNVKTVDVYDFGPAPCRASRRRSMSGSTQRTITTCPERRKERQRRWVPSRG